MNLIDETLGPLRGAAEPGITEGFENEVAALLVLIAGERRRIARSTIAVILITMCFSLFFTVETICPLDFIVKGYYQFQKRPGRSILFAKSDKFLNSKAVKYAKAPSFSGIERRKGEQRSKEKIEDILASPCRDFNLGFAFIC